jgi:prophage regulatory protein
VRKITRLPAVIEYTGLSRSSIYRLIKRGKFPAPILIGEKATAWRMDELEAWLESRQKPDAHIYKEARAILSGKGR